MLLGCGVRPQCDDSAAALRWPSQATSDASRIVCIPGASSSTGFPAKDSVVVTRTPLGVSLKSHSCTPVIPPEVPPQRTRDRSARA
jgi:hypothetical protein